MARFAPNRRWQAKRWGHLRGTMDEMGLPDDPTPSVGMGRLALWLLATCAGLITVFWLVTRSGPTPLARQAPTITPSPGPNLDFGSPPRGLAVFYYVDARQRSWLLASDWNAA